MAEAQDVQQLVDNIQPLPGQVTPIKTVQETKPPEEFGDAYVAEINIKSASKVIKTLDSKLHRDPSSPSLNHRRRFAKWDFLPEHLRSLVKTEPTPHTIFVLISPPLPGVEELQSILAPFAPHPAECPLPPTAEPAPPSRIHIYTIRIPLLPPLNAHQADTWTKTLWPVAFNPAAPRAAVAAPRQVINSVYESIQPVAGHYLALAEKVAEEAELSGRGRRVGAVVVDPAIKERIDKVDDKNENNWMDAIIALAGDARYSRREGGSPSQSELHPGIGANPASESYNPDLEGGPELHALMRSVDIIASKRRGNDREYSKDRPDLSPLESYFLSLPVPQALKNDLAGGEEDEQGNSTMQTSRIRSRAQGGYLCTDLDIYISREPCLCCSMGMLLSRFRAVIFPRKGRLITGGLASEPVISPTPVEAETESSGMREQTQDISLSVGEDRWDQIIDPSLRDIYYGLHWRKELNWRALGFEFVEDGSSLDVPGVAFHA
ncbi:tRNA-specific adenosine-34 deaminase subunit [Aspergillus sclerotialis]|uniref:tRNA-specific adenosine-34 deaminase subunit n=1 Tax=Aspergillus sclerotialis TaxID=2070753 RepID=A0A3A2ZL70_9EURO|nr:tRNA-specific adenosine-34 deaminase subunit [Aspergillus sclerotialis]